MAPRYNRREFLRTSTALSVGALSLTACPRTPEVRKGVVVWRRSARGRRVSNAAKKHAANHLYLTRQDAINDPAHPGDNTKIVEITISNDLHDDLFALGRRAVDLRQFL